MRRFPDWLVARLMFAIVTATGVASAQVLPLGPEFQVNSYTTGYQGAPDVATDASGKVVVVWQSGLEGIRGQRYDATGVPVGGEFQVNAFTTAAQALFPDVSSDSVGNFVVVWQSLGSSGPDDAGSSIQARRFDNTGAPLGAEFQVNTYTTGDQQLPKVDRDASGNFIVVWHSAGSAGTDSDDRSVHAQRYDSLGAAVGTEIQVNTYTTGFQDNPRIVINGMGDFLVAWRSGGSAGSDSSGTSMQGQRFNSAGTPLGTEFQINTYTTGFQGPGAIAVDTGGDFVVVWDSSGSAGSDPDASVQGQRYDSTGAPLGGEFQVNTHTTSGQGSADVAADPTGNFVVVWEDISGGVGVDASGSSIQGQRFDGSGAPLGGQFQVNTYTTGVQEEPQVAPDPIGNFVVVWQGDGSSGSDNSDYSVQGQREGSARILGKKLIVRDPTGDENRRTVVALGKESTTDMGPLILGNPTVSGATLRIVTTGATPSDQTYVLDAAGWRVLGSFGYSYRGPTGGDGDPVQRVRLKRTPRGVGLLQAMLRGGLGTQSLDVVPPNPGIEGALVLTVNGGGSYCVAFGGAAGGNEVDDSATRWKITNATGQTCP